MHLRKLAQCQGYRKPSKMFLVVIVSSVTLQGSVILESCY